MFNISVIAVLSGVLLGGLPDAEAGAGVRQVRVGAGHPNVVILLADDLGYGDLGCYGHPTIRTPNLDRMAGRGDEAHPVLFRGLGLHTESSGAAHRQIAGAQRLDRVLLPFSRSGLPSGEITLAESLKSRGYATMCVGKWHLGHEPEFLPTRHGFDRFLGPAVQP